MRHEFDNLSPDRPLRVLLCEDESLSRYALSEVLTLAGYIVDEAVTGTEGIEYLQHQAYDILLLDLMMPGEDGFQVLDFLRTQKNTPQVIVMTGMDPDDIQRRMARMNLKDLPTLFLKPIDADSLLNFVAASQLDPALKASY